MITDDETLFRQGVSAYDGGHYREAAALFEQVQTVNPRSIRLTAATIMKAKALYWLGENMESVRIARALLTTAPGSAYVADAHFIIGSVYHRIGRVNEALEEYALAWRALPHPAPPRLYDALGSIVDTIAGRELSMDALTRAIASDGPRGVHGPPDSQPRREVCEGGEHPGGASYARYASLHFLRRNRASHGQ